MPVTLKDVAARAGVTPTVVSHVLHNKANSIRVSEATAARVRLASEELGYRVNVMARNFRERQTMMIGVLHGVGFARPILDHGSRYFASLMDGIVEGAFQYGYSVTLCPKLLGSSPDDALADGRFDGLVWYSTLPNAANTDMLRRCNVPLVLIHTAAHEFDNKYPSVRCDNEQGISLAVDHLVELGHTRIGFARESSLMFTESPIRTGAYVNRMRFHGLPVSDCDILDVNDSPTAVEEYFASDLRHTAIIAHNEWLAAHIMERAQRFGLDVPEDLSVIGYDSTRFCEELTPKLTAVFQPLAVMGRSAIDLLIRNIGGEKPDPLELVFPCSLDVRGSTSIPHR